MDPLAYSQQILLPCASPTAQDHGFGMGRAQNTLSLSLSRSLLGQKHIVESKMPKCLITELSKYSRMTPTHLHL